MSELDMSELDYIGANELVFNNDVDAGIHSGGFDVKSIMMKLGMSPITTLNNPTSIIGGGNKVSDLFNDLVVPNWTLSYNNRIVGGKYKEVEHDNSDTDDEVIEDDLHDKLLDLVKEHNIKTNNSISKKKMTRKIKKNSSKKGQTKRRK
jgi:hypothetical protein